MFCIVYLIIVSSISFADSDKPFIPPVSEGRITSFFGARNLFGRNFHYGIDIAVPIGTPVYAAQDGVISYSGNRGGYGKLIEIKHIGALKDYSTRYGHNSSLVASVGDTVKKGDVIAYSGNTGDSTGPHVHYEVRINNKPYNPLTFTDFTGFKHSDFPLAGTADVVDLISMGINNTVVLFFNIVEEQIMHPFMANISIALKVDLDITKVAVVQLLYQSIREMSFKLLPFIILFYIAKMSFLNLIGQKREFINHTFFKFFRAGILMQFSLFFTGMFLGTVTSVIMFFIRYVDSDYSKLMLPEDDLGMNTYFALNTMLFTLLFFIYLILFVVVIIRILDLALITVLTPLIIPFAEFVDRSLYMKLSNIYVGIPVAQFTTVLCLAFAIGFAQAPTPALQSLGVLGTFIISLSSAIYALKQPAQVKKIFQIDSIDAIDALLVAAKSMMVAFN